MRRLFGSLLAFLFVTSIFAQDTRPEPNAYERVESGKRLFEGVQLFYRGEFRSAEKSLDLALDFNPNNIEAQYYNGLLYLRTGRPEESIPFLQNIVDEGLSDSYPVLWKLNMARTRLDLSIENRKKLFSRKEYRLVKDISGRDYKTGYFSFPASVRFDLIEKSIFLTSYNTGELISLDQNGRKLDSWKFPSASGIRGLFLDKDYIFSTLFRTNRVVGVPRRNVDGEEMEFGARGRGLGDIIGPSGITRDRLGNFYVSEKGNQRISVFDNRGRGISLIGGYGTEPGLFNGPGDILLDRKGKIYVSDERNRRIQVFSINGLIEKEIPVPDREIPAGFSSVRRDNSFYLATREGKVYSVQNGKINQDPVSFNDVDSDSDVIVTDIDIDEKDYFYIADARGNRVRIYRPEPIVEDRIQFELQKIDLSHYTDDHLVGIRARVRDIKGNYYPGLTGENFAVFENDDRMFPITVREMRGKKDVSLYLVINEDKHNARELYRRFRLQMTDHNVSLAGLVSAGAKSDTFLYKAGEIETSTSVFSALKKSLWRAYYDPGRRAVVYFAVEPVMTDTERREVINLAWGLGVPIHIITPAPYSEFSELAGWTGGKIYETESELFEEDVRNISLDTYQSEYLLVYRTPYRNVPYKTVFEVMVLLNLYLNSLDDPKGLVYRDRMIYYVP